MYQIGELKRVPIRQVWADEARDFTVWLEGNIEVLGEAINTELSSVESEKSVGDFNVDLVAEDESGGRVVIENQFGQSDHDHLGKLLTYLAGTEASAAVWIVERPRAEHIDTVSWLNEKPQAEFYLVKLEAVQIENSPAAPLLTLIQGPSEASQAAGQSKENWAERERLRHDYWANFLPRANDATAILSNRSATKNSALSGPAGRSGLRFECVVREHDARIQLKIDTGDRGKNRKVFDQLEGYKQQIEAAFGQELDWLKREGADRCYVRKDVEVPGYRDRGQWEEGHEELAELLASFETACEPSIQRLDM